MFDTGHPADVDPAASANSDDGDQLYDNGPAPVEEPIALSIVVSPEQIDVFVDDATALGIEFTLTCTVSDALHVF